MLLNTVFHLFLIWMTDCPQNHCLLFMQRGFFLLPLFLCLLSNPHHPLDNPLDNNEQALFLATAEMKKRIFWTDRGHGNDNVGGHKLRTRARANLSAYAERLMIERERPKCKRVWGQTWKKLSCPQKRHANRMIIKTRKSVEHLIGVEHNLALSLSVLV